MLNFLVHQSAEVHETNEREIEFEHKFIKECEPYMTQRFKLLERTPEEIQVN